VSSFFSLTAGIEGTTGGDEVPVDLQKIGVSARVSRPPSSSFGFLLIVEVKVSAEVRDADRGKSVGSWGQALESCLSLPVF